MSFKEQFRNKIAGISLASIAISPIIYHSQNSEEYSNVNFTSTAQVQKDKDDRYKVKKGDTLIEIAKKELGDGSKWKQIARKNHISHPSEIKAGEILFISGQHSSNNKKDSSTKKDKRPYWKKIVNHPTKAMRELAKAAPKGARKAHREEVAQGQSPGTYGDCAKGVRMSIGMAFGNDLMYEVMRGYAKDYFQSLPASGEFRRVRMPWSKVVDTPGLVVVFKPYPGSPEAGHIFITDGRGNEISDYKARARHRGSEHVVYAPIAKTREQLRQEEIREKRQEKRQEQAEKRREKREERKENKLDKKHNEKSDKINDESVNDVPVTPAIPPIEPEPTELPVTPPAEPEPTGVPVTPEAPSVDTPTTPPAAPENESESTLEKLQNFISKLDDLKII